MSYARAVGGQASWPDIDTLSKTIQAGSTTRVIIAQNDYESVRQNFRFALIGHVNFRVNSLNDLSKEAAERWNLKLRVLMHTLRKGYVIFQFGSDGDMSSVWRRSPIRFGELNLEYRHENILLSMAKAVSRSVALNRRMRQGLMGHYARVLVEVNVTESASRVEEIQVVRKEPGMNKEFCFRQSIVYEDAMVKCGFCKKVGHQVMDCRLRKQE
ncbi:uncharacterized protein LOC122091598 [Macadamia integrifolia]|uniref:uncharacterized protein LOC122091598 n=1 Tax=Macadamia integrifolia TaxID=60698 RepID=UPI001C4FC8F5|nr:uncharacterized protein LOC122091598 [Macadamia integrifolia]